MRHLNSSSRSSALFALILGSLLAASGWAQIDAAEDLGPVEPDEIRGEVVAVDESADTLTVIPMEVGEDLSIPTGGEQTFEVNEDTVITDDVYATVLDSLDNIQPRDIVRLDFDTDASGRMTARNISRDQGSDQQQVAQLDQRPDQLPATASLLPLLAAGGLGIWLLALVLRLSRQTRR